MNRLITHSIAALVLAGCASTSPVQPTSPGSPAPTSTPVSKSAKTAPYQVLGKRYFPITDATGYRERGVASWYGGKFHGRQTANGERYDMYQYTAAHKTLPLPTWVRVTNLRNGTEVIVKVNDRGPFVKNRLIDMSYAAALRLGMVDDGTTLVTVEAIDPPSSQSRPVVAAMPAPPVRTSLPPQSVATPSPALPASVQPATVTPPIQEIPASAALEPVSEIRRDIPASVALEAVGETRREIPASAALEPVSEIRREMPASAALEPISEIRREIPASAPSKPVADTAQPVSVGGQPDLTTAATAEMTAPPKLFVQVGAFGNIVNAQRLQTNLYNAGLTGVRLNGGYLEDIPVYRVQIGPVTGVVEYDVLMARLDSLGISDTHLVTE